MIKNLRSLRDGELNRKNIEFDQIQHLLLTYVHSMHDYLYHSSLIFLFFSRTRENRFEDVLDLYIQLVLRQGQVEFEARPADLPPDHYRNTEMELINRREVEELNKSIIVTDRSILSLL